MGLGSLWMLISTGVLNLSMVLYWRVMSENLGDSYAELAALSALTNVLGVITLGASTTLVKVFAEDEAEGGLGAAKGRLVSLLPGLGKAMLGAALLLGLIAPLALAYLKIQSVWPYALLAGAFVCNLGILAARAAVQGTQRFGALALSMSFEGVGRVGFGALLVGAGFGVSGALGGSFLAQFVGLAFCLISIRGFGAVQRPPERQLGQGLTEMAADAAALGVFSLICFLDVFVMKHLLADAPAGDYTRAALVAKSFLYLAAALNMVLLPAVSSARAKGGEASAKKALIKFLAGALAIEIVGLAFVWAFTPFVIRVLCGGKESFQALAPLVRVFSAAVIPLALAQLVLYYLLAVRDYRVLWLLSGVAAAYAILLHLAGGDASAVVARLGLVAAVLLSASLWLAFVPKKNYDAKTA